MILHNCAFRLLLIFSIFLGYCFSVNPVSNEYNCLVNLVENFNLLKFTKDNSTGGYINICSTTDIVCYGNYISKLVLNGGGSENILSPSNFSDCFPMMTELVVNNLKVSPDFIYYKYSNTQTIRYSNITGIVGGITQPLPPYRVIQIFSNDFKDTTFRMEFINKQTYSLDFQNGPYLYLNSDGANLDRASILANFNIYAHNLVDLSNYKSFSTVQLLFSSTFNYSTTPHIKTITTNQLIIYDDINPGTIDIDQFLFDDTRINYFSLASKLKSPSQYIDMASFKNHTYSTFSLYPGPLFHINGSIPLIPPKNLQLSFFSGNLTVFPNNLQLSQYVTTNFQNSIKTSQFPKFLGSGGSYDFRGSSYTGTIDESWCTTEIAISPGNLTGEIPSCYACYFNVTSIKSYSKLTAKSMAQRFYGNNFSNYNIKSCTTFRPRVELINDGVFNKVMVTGNDIGFDVSLWMINSTIQLNSTTYVINENGKNYTATMVGDSVNLKDVEYFSVLFTIPNNVLYTFPSNYNIPPILKSVLVKSSGNQIQVSGTHFSSYLEFTSQQIQIVNVGNCSTITSSDFFGAQCTMEGGKLLSTSNSTVPLYIITIDKDSFNVKAYIKIEANFNNDQVCPNDCSTSVGVNSICDLSSGTCKCLPGFFGNDCLGIECKAPGCFGNSYCNTTIGQCVCNSSSQGSNCSLPFIQCPIYNTLPCNGGSNTCNNQTGVCNCGPSNQGDDCSLPVIECDPSDCNSNGVCDRIKGQCICKEYVWAGPTCLIPYHYITSVIPSTTKGGVASFIGFFGDIHNNLSITIGNLPCLILHNSSSIINCTAPAGVGNKIVIVIQNNITYSYDKYQYINLNNQTCPNKCSNQGTCNTTIGQCKCNNGFNGVDCSGVINTGGVNGGGGSNSDGDKGGNGNPTTDTGVDPGSGNTTITNQEINFQIFFKSLYEIDINGNIVESYSLQNSWTSNSTSGENETVYTLSQTIRNNCTIVSKIEEITNRNGKEFTFADTTFNLQYGSIKFSIGIYNYKYKNNLNTLKLELVSSVDQSISDNNECNKKETSLDTINNLDGESTFNYIKISKNNKILEGRFINKLISDGKATYLLTSMKPESKDSISIS
ncbi:hypothetical protein RB653_003099 [Dictyostelium firmibasis]|uniref:EGF-like domain-containing protein n=1 Tax=Dictyostelium firmibasis TaxID=79012 RepID=A0AAN7YQL3_9MYCE